MNFSKNRITIKLVVSYVLAFILSIAAFGLFYNQLSQLTAISNGSSSQTEHVFLISETIADLYEAESLGRELITSKSPQVLEDYQLKMDRINFSIDVLVKGFTDSSQRIRMNSIKDLLRRKNITVKELKEIYAKKNSESVYANAMEELKEIDPTFKDYRYSNRFKNLAKHQRKYLIGLLEYSKKDNQNRISNKTVDSIAESVTKVLLRLAKKERTLQKVIQDKEKKIIEDDRFLGAQLRSILIDLQFQEWRLSAKQLRESRVILSRTYKIILFTSLLTLITALTFFYFINRDVARSNEHRLEQENSRKYAEELLKSKENLMNMVTHDIRAPLHSILGYLEILKNSDIDIKKIHYVDQARKSSDYMLQLVNDLLDFSKMKGDKLHIETKPFQPSIVIRNAIKQSIPSDNPKGIKIHQSIATELTDRLLVSDPYRIKQILVNLISNAYKFTNKGSITIAASLKEKSGKSMLELSVSDSGVGISEELQEEIFNAFYQEKTIIASNYKGFGLGLYIAKTLIDLLGGTITLKSKLQKGSTFSCLLPVQVKKITPKIGVPKINKSLHVVLVDDEPVQSQILETLFDRYKIAYTSFTDATKAITFCERNIPDLILSDIQMPRMDGFEFLENLKANIKTKAIPVIALTGNTKYSKENYKEKGFVNCFLKPFAPNDLLDFISVLFNMEKPTLKSEVILKNNNTTTFDINDMLLFLDNDIIAVKKVLTTFYESTQKNIQLWDEAVITKDYELLQKLIHKIAPMFVQLKAVTIAKELRVLEFQKEELSKVKFYTSCEEVSVLIKQLLKEVEVFLKKE